MSATSHFRPDYHFTSEKNWINDPNGLVYVDGVYHLFYQYNPHGSDWGNMSWGHATSTDLFTWVEHPVALLFEDDVQIYSGSIVVDHDNSSGFGIVGVPPLVAMYTSAHLDGKQTQSIAYSTNRGASWTKYEGNPVLDRDSGDFRDPKIIRFGTGSSARWIAVVAEAVEKRVIFYESANLVDWTLAGSFSAPSNTEGVWECPDLFQLEAEDTGESRWVLLISRNSRSADVGSLQEYFVGDFDGRSFTPEMSEDGDPFVGRVDWGHDFYAGVTFDNVPDGRRILMAWMNNWNYARTTPTAPWRGSMTLPRELALRRDPSGYRLRSRPIDPRRASETPTCSIGPLEITPGRSQRVKLTGPGARLDLTVELGDADQIGLILLASDTPLLRLNYSAICSALTLDRELGSPFFSSQTTSVATAPLSQDGTLDLSIFLDASSIEVFAHDGQTTITELLFPLAHADTVELCARNGRAKVSSFAITPITPISTHGTPSEPSEQGGSPVLVSDETGS